MASLNGQLGWAGEIPGLGGRRSYDSWDILRDGELAGGLSLDEAGKLIWKEYLLISVRSAVRPRHSP